MNKLIFRYILWAHLLFFWSCKAPQIAQNNKLKPLPETFGVGKDTANSTTVNWKQFFQDSTLVGLIEEGLRNNLDLQMTMQNLEKATAEIRLHQGNLLPTVGVGGSTTLRKFGLYTMDGAGNATTPMRPDSDKLVPVHLPDFFIGLQTAWEADIWGKLRNRRQGAILRFLATLEGRNLITTNLVAEIALAYYELLSLDNAQEIIRENVRLQENALEIVKAQQEAGKANSLAIEQFEAQLLDLQSMEVQARREILAHENLINILLARYPQAIPRNRNAFFQALPIVQTGVPSALLQNRPDIRQAEYVLQSTQADLKATRAQFFPSLVIAGSVGVQGYSPEILFSPKSIAYGILGNFFAPIINRKALHAEFQMAQASQREAFLAYQKTVLTAFSEVALQMAYLQNAEELHTLKGKEVAILTKSIDTVSELFRTNRAGFLEILFAQQNVLQARIAQIEAKQQQFNALVNVYKALGGGWR